MKTLKDLAVGDHVHVYMKVGLALETGYNPSGEVFRYVPSRVRVSSPNALTRFTGVITNNDLTTGILSINTVAMNSKMVPTSSSLNLPVEIHFSAIKKLLLVSKINYAPKAEVHRGGTEFRPTTNAIGTAYRAYKTLELIKL